MDTKAVWEKVKEHLLQSGKIQSHSLELWIERLVLEDGKSWTIFCPNSHFKNRLKEKYLAFVENALKAVCGERRRIEVEISQEKICRPAKHTGKKTCNAQIPLCGERSGDTGNSMEMKINKNLTFKNFVAGECNELAHMACLHLASGKSNVHPLLIMGNPGMGKSHLVQAVAHEVLATNENSRVLYSTTEDFSGEMGQSFRFKTIDAFRDKYKKSDVLLIDDIHQISGKNRTQIELNQILRKLKDTGKRTVLTSCYQLSDIPELLGELKSLISSFVPIQIGPLDFETKIRIIKKKTADAKCPLSHEVAQYIARETNGDVRQIEGIINSMCMRSSLLMADPNIEMAEKAIKTANCRNGKITIDQIKKMVCREFNITEKDISSSCRKSTIVEARRMGIYLASIYTDFPINTICKAFNKSRQMADKYINEVSSALVPGRRDGKISAKVEFFRQKIESGKF